MHRARVSTATVAEVDAAQDEVNEGEENVLPDLWVPDSPAWQTVLIGAGLTGKLVDPRWPPARSGLAGGTEGMAPANWLAALSSPRLVKADPRASGAFAETCSRRSPKRPKPAATSPRPRAPSLRSRRSSGPRWRPVGTDRSPSTHPGRKQAARPGHRAGLPDRSPQQRRAHLAAPDTGAPVLKFPLVQPDAGAGGIGVGSGSLDVAGRTGEGSPRGSRRRRASRPSRREAARTRRRAAARRRGRHVRPSSCRPRR